MGNASRIYCKHRTFTKGNSGFGNGWVILTLFLAVAAACLGWGLFSSVRHLDSEIAVLLQTPVSRTADRVSSLPPAPIPQKRSPEEFAIIEAQNVFADSRNNQKEEVKAPEVIPELKIRPILVGVIVNGDHAAATLAEPDPPNVPPGTGYRTQVKHVGDVYQGFTVTEISKDRMVLQSGSHQEIIAMFQGSSLAERQRGKTEVIGTRVVGFGPAVAGAAPPAPVTTSVAQNRTQPSGTPAQSPGLLVTTMDPAAAFQGRPAVAAVAPVVGGAPVARGVDFKTNARVVQTPLGQFVTYPP